MSQLYEDIVLDVSGRVATITINPGVAGRRASLP